MDHLEKDKKNISELIELNDELENYFRNTIIPQLFIDSDLILRKYTPPAMTQFNFSPANIGMPFEKLIDNIRYSNIMDDIHHVINTGEILEKQIQTTDLRWFRMNIIPYIIQKENKNNGVIITFVDITDHIKDIKDLEKLNAEHETFIYSISHDLKAPLANIEGLIKSLTELEYDKEQKIISEMLDKAVKTMKDIINELSDITKIEGNYHENIETVNFYNILNEVELVIQDKILESKAQIKTDFKEKQIKFSRKNLRSIIYNLLSNAIKYRSPERPLEIEIKTVLENGLVMLSVKDNGIGIVEDKLESIFSQFTRYQKNVEGIGLGLYLVKKIINNEGGNIIVDSKVGQGSVFKVYLNKKEQA
jgi:two-component system, OmpR family, phosphate regulon sensor histidine kinase PhoR